MKELGYFQEQLAKDIKTMISCTEKEEYKIDKEVLVDSEAFYSLKSKLNRLKKQIQAQKNLKEKYNILEAKDKLNVIEIEKYKQHIEMMQQHTKQLEDITKMKLMQDKLKDTLQELEQQQKAQQEREKKLTVQMWRKQQKVSELKQKIQDNQDFVQDFKTKKIEYEKQFYEFQKKIEELNYLLSQKNEQMGMLMEDFTQIRELKNTCKILRAQLKASRLRFDQLEANLQQGAINYTKEPYIWIPLSDPIFNVARQIEIPSPYESFKQNLKLRTVSQPIILNQDTIEVDTINLDTFRFQRQTYASLLAVEHKSKVQYEQPFQGWLYLIIRNIFDAKYYEHLSIDNFPSRFPDFVYSWLGQFEIDENTRSVKEVDYWKKPTDQSRINLLSAIRQTSLDNMWEINNFYSFLTEEFDIDELAFYLYCRYVIFKQPQMQTVQGKFADVHFIGLKQAFEVIDQVMHKVDQQEIEKLKQSIENKSFFSKKTHNIDSAFLLRVLLVYYRREKQAKVAAVLKICESAPKVGKVMPFNSVRSICQMLDKNIKDTQVAKIYRDTLLYSNGRFNPVCFILAVNENFVFYNTLELNYHKNPLPLKANLDINETKGHYPAKMAYIQKLWDKNYILKKQITEIFTQIPLPDTLQTFQRLLQLMNQKMQQPLTNYSHLDLLDIHQLIYIQISKLGVIFEQSNRDIQTVVFNPEEKNHDIHAFIKPAQPFLQHIHGILVNDLRRRIKLRSIQRNWRRSTLISLSTTTKVLQAVSRFKQGRLKRK